MEKKKKKNNPYDTSESPIIRSNNRNGTFKRTSFDELPSIDLLAKFAAEKDRQERLLQNSEAEEASFNIDANNNQYDQQQTRDKDGDRKSKKLKKLVSRKQTKVSEIDGYDNRSNVMMRSGTLDPIVDNEKRLNELERLAVASAGIKSMGMNSQNNGPLGSIMSTQLTTSLSASSLVSRTANSISSANSNLSGTEAEFINRQIQSADVNQLSVIANNEEFSISAEMKESKNDTKNSSQNRSEISTANVITDALKERINKLERQIDSQNQIIKKRESELEKKDNKLRKMVLELDAARKESENEIKQLQTEHEKDIIRIREQHAREKALLASTVNRSIETSISRSKKNGSDSNSSSPTKQNGYEANSRLLEQIESLQTEYRQLQDQYSDERRQIQIEFNNKLSIQERKFKSEIMELKSIQVGLEDKIATSEEDLKASRFKIQGLENLNNQLEYSKQAALEGQIKLRADLKNMQQSVQASYRLESSQGIGVSSADFESTIRLNDAKNEAKLRQLMNKVEFLKAQLETEKKTTDEAKVAMENSKQKLEEIREEFKFRMQENEQSRKNAVAEAEQRIESYYEDRMKEFTALQSKLMVTQGQLQETIQDSQQSKLREESAKAAANKSLAHQTALRTEIEGLRNQLQAMRDEKEQELAREAGKQSNEAMIRRLDNERQYLKSQLASEITHKNELQSALNRCQQQLSDVQKQWKMDVETLKDTNVLDVQKYVANEDKLKQSEIHLKSEMDRFSNQNKELKEGFVKMRDQLRIEQVALENSNSSNRRLQENLDAANNDIAKLRQIEEQNSANYKKQIKAIHDSFKEQENLRNEEIMSLKEELSKQFMINSAAQVASLDMREKFENNNVKLIKQTHAVKIYGIINRWRLARLGNGFRLWSSNTTLINVATQFRGHVETLLKQNTDDLNSEKLNALESLKKKMIKEFNIKTSLNKAEFEDQLRKALEAAEENKLKAIENANLEFENRLKQAEADFLFDLDSCRNAGDEAVNKAIISKNKEIDRMMDRNRLDAELALKDANHREKVAVEAKEVEMNSIWNEKMQQKEAELLSQQQRLLMNAAVEYDFKLFTMEGDHKAEISSLIAKHDAHLKLREDELEAQHRNDVNNINEKHENDMNALKQALATEENLKMKALRAAMHEESEQRIRQLRVEWQQEFDDKVKEKTIELEALFEEKSEQHARLMEVEKIKAVKLEASKWRQAMQEADQTLELEVLKGKAEVSAEKEIEMQIEKEKLNNLFEIEKQRDRNRNESAMNTLRNEYEDKLKKMSIQHSIDMDQLKLHLTKSLSDELNTQWAEKMEKSLAENEKSWNKKLLKEREVLEQFKADVSIQSQHFAKERTSLQARITKNEDLIKTLEDKNKEDQIQLTKEFEEEKQLLKLKWDEMKNREWETLQQKKMEEIKALEENYRDMTALQIKSEKVRMQEELSKQMNQLQEESENLIQGLEDALSELRNQKEGLSAQLGEALNKLEASEDTLFDLQREMKSLVKSHSIDTWKGAVNVMGLKDRFKRNMADFEDEANIRYDELKREMQIKINDQMLITLKLAALLQSAEESRQNMLITLTSYKTDELYSKRQKIKLLEKELERLTMEKDSLDEQKEMMDTEIDQLEQQVRELEDQIREHNRTSSMTNGRINVAHARKKRRLDSELEKMLDSIEQKRISMSTLEQRTSEKTKQRDEKDLEIIELEKDVMRVLVEQQRSVLVQVDDWKSINEHCRVIMNIGRLPWPSPHEPTLADVAAVLKKREKEDEDARLN
eukprot:gene4884-6841_t